MALGEGDALKEKGNALYKERKFEDAKYVYSEAIEKMPEAYTLLSNRYFFRFRTAGIATPTAQFLLAVVSSNKATTPYLETLTRAK